MKENRFSPIELNFLIIFSILLILVGAGLLMHEFGNYGDVVADNQDSYLLNSVRYVDNNLSAQIDTYQKELIYVANRRGFLSDAELWRSGKGSDGLLERMRDNLLSDDPAITAMLAVQDGQIMLSTNGLTDYILPSVMTEGQLFSALSPRNEVFLGLCHVKPDVTFVALVNLEKCFQQMQQALPVDTDRLFMLHEDVGFFIHTSGNRICVDHVSTLDGSHPDASVLAAMRTSETIDRTATISFISESGSEQMQARLAVMPAKALSNGQLCIALSVDYGTITAPLYESVQHVLFLATGTMIGVVLLTLAAIYTYMNNARHSRELEELERRNEEMTKLTEKTLSLYHHQRLETIGTLTSSIAHEFGNLLTPIMGYSIMTMEALPPEYDELADNLQEIYNASCSAKSIISRLSDLSRKNTGASYKYLQPDELVQRTLAVSQPARPGSVTVSADLRASGLWLRGNETQLSQMLLNLTLNAFHAMKESGGTLTVSTRAEGDRLHIRFRDTGKGIPPENMEKIFDPFFTTREAGKGTGLGLPISRQVTQEHGGSISAVSTPGEGSCFEVVLPLSSPPPVSED